MRAVAYSRCSLQPNVASVDMKKEITTFWLFDLIDVLGSRGYRDVYLDYILQMGWDGMRDGKEGNCEGIWCFLPKKGSLGSLGSLYNMSKVSPSSFVSLHDQPNYRDSFHLILATCQSSQIPPPHRPSFSHLRSRTWPHGLSSATFSSRLYQNAPPVTLIILHPPHHITTFIPHPSSCPPSRHQEKTQSNHPLIFPAF